MIFRQIFSKLKKWKEISRRLQAEKQAKIDIDRLKRELEELKSKLNQLPQQNTQQTYNNYNTIPKQKVLKQIQPQQRVAAAPELLHLYNDQPDQYLSSKRNLLVDYFFALFFF